MLEKKPLSSLDDRTYTEQLRDAYALAEFALANMDREAMAEARERIANLIFRTPKDMADNGDYVNFR